MKSKRTLDEPYKNSPKRARNALINNGEQEVSSQFDASMSYDDSIFDRDDPEIHLDENFDTENISNNADYGQNGMDYSVSQDQIYSNDEATNIGSKNSNYQASLKIIEERNHNSSCNLGEIGHIKSITLQNFMCHANFHLDFGPRVNFIVGQNGSGKSAILNGIVLGLGGRATHTNRGSGLATFIKNGETRAKIVIKLSNGIKNVDTKIGYMFNHYGETIIVERIINLNGTSNYKIKSEKGKVISEKKEELDNILKHLSIHIDNPICVLTQEVSKNFLNSKSAHDKFRFFVKATQIEDTKNDYECSINNHKMAVKQIKIKEQLLAGYERQIKELKKKLDIIDKIKNNLEKIQKLTYEALWANIIKSEKELAEERKIFDGYLTKIKNNSHKIEINDSKMEELNKEKETLVKNLNDLELLKEQTNQELKDLKEKFRSAKYSLTEKETQLRVIKNDQNLIIKEIKEIKERIYGIEKTSQECKELDINKMIEDKKNEIDRKKSSMDGLRTKVEELESEIQIVKEKQVKSNEEQRKINARIAAIKNELERLNRSEKNKLGRYGPKYPELNQRIENLHQNGKFKYKPLGPIGEFIRLRNSSATLAVECCLRYFLYAYVVDNGDDAQVLKKLISQLFGNQKAPTIIVRKFTSIHNVANTETISDRYENFLQLVNIKSQFAPVANCLIDHLRLEQILYIPDFKEAQRILIRRESVPRNCQMAYTSEGDLMYPSNNRGEYKCYPNTNKNKIAKILIEDSAKSKEHYKRIIDSLKEEHLKYYEEAKELRDKYEMGKKTISDYNHQINVSKMEQMNLETQLAELNVKAETYHVEVQVLKEEVEKLMEERNKLQVQIDEFIQQRETFRNEYVNLENELNEKNQSNNDLMKEFDLISQKIANLSEKLDELKQKKQYLTVELEKTKDLKYDKEKQIANLYDELGANENHALQLTNGRIETNRSSSEICNEINEIKFIVEEHKDLCVEEEQQEITKQYSSLKSTIDDVKNNLILLNNYLNLVEKSLSKRSNAYQQMRIFILQQINRHFFDCLRQKEFVGKIRVNYKDIIDPETGIMKKGQTLEVDIKPRKEFHEEINSQCSEITSYSSTRSLSGGERSFSTVAFIISLWQICQSPFKILDEVDVFMDMVTRKISLDTLVEFAAVNSKKQFIFLSPLQLQQFEHSSAIKIFRMPEPERK